MRPPLFIKYLLFDLFARMDSENTKLLGETSHESTGSWSKPGGGQPDGPPPFQGWVKKQARSKLFANWQIRYMTLDFGLLKYFEGFDEEVIHRSVC